MKIPRPGYRANPTVVGDALIPLNSPKLTQELHEMKTPRLQLAEAIPWWWGGLQKAQGSLKLWGIHGMNKQDAKEE